MAGLRLPEQNHVVLVGRLTRDPDLRFTQKGSAMCRFTIAVNRRYKDAATGEWKDDTSFIPVVTWRQVAEQCGQRLKKGGPVQVEGRLKSRQFEDKQGQKREVLEVEARRVQFLESAPSQGPAPAPAAAAPGETVADAPAADEPGPDLEEVPF